MKDLATLMSEMRACTACEDLPLGPNPIFQLDKSVKILIAGQAPGRITHLKGRPFDDPSGDRLREWLAIEKSTFYSDSRIGIFPMGLCFPGGGSSGDYPPREICAAIWRKPVLAELNEVELTLVLGAHAIARHFPHLKGKTVAQAVQLSMKERGNVFILPHPSPRNNRWLKQNPWFETTVLPTIQQNVRRLLSV